MNPQTSHETEADKILEGCFRNYNWNSRKIEYCSDITGLCPVCISFAKGLLTAYKEELEFLLNQGYFEGVNDEERKQERIQHLESEIKKLSEGLK